MKTQAALMALIIASGIATPASSASDGTAVQRRSYLQNYKDSALAFCIARAYRAAPAAAADASASASGIAEWGNEDAERSTGKVPTLVDQYLARTYGSFQGPSVRLDLMKCMDMYHGPELEALGRRYVAHPDHSYAQDHPAHR